MTVIKSITMNNDIDRFSNVFDLLYDGVIIVDNEGHIVFANTACQRIFGYCNASLIGQPLDVLIPKEYRQQHHRDIIEYKKDPQPRLMGERSVLYGINNLGEQVPVTISIATFNGDHDYFIAVVRDGALINRQFEREKIRAETDALTQLGNRHYLSRMFDEKSKKQRRPFAVLFIDLNKFKPVNDEYGHEAGDKTLQIVAKRLNAVLRSNDIVVRVGGDEFAVLLCNISDKQSIKPIIRKIIHSISRPIHIEQAIVNIGASIGCSLYPEDGQTEKELLHKADNAMYRAKMLGTGFGFYEEEKSAAKK